MFIRINTVITEIISAVIYWYDVVCTLCAESVFCFLGSQQLQDLVVKRMSQNNTYNPHNSATEFHSHRFNSVENIDHFSLMFDVSIDVMIISTDGSDRKKFDFSTAFQKLASKCVRKTFK